MVLSNPVACSLQGLKATLASTRPLQYSNILHASRLYTNSFALPILTPCFPVPIFHTIISFTPRSSRNLLPIYLYPLHCPRLIYSYNIIRPAKHILLYSHSGDFFTLHKFFTTAFLMSHSCIKSVSTVLSLTS